jgi:hypothetical protein
MANDIPGQHLVAAYAPQVQAVLAQVRVDAKTNEDKAALQLLGLISVQDKIVVGVRDVTMREDACRVRRGTAPQVITRPGSEKTRPATKAVGATMSNSRLRNSK